MFQTGGGVGFGAARYSRSDGECFVVTLEPGQEGRLFGPGRRCSSAVVIGTHVGIDQEPRGSSSETSWLAESISFMGFCAGAGEADQKSERLGATEGFASRPWANVVLKIACRSLQ